MKTVKKYSIDMLKKITDKEFLCWLMNRWYTPKETVSEPEDRSLEVIQSEKQRGTKVGVKKILNRVPRTVGQYQTVQFICHGSHRKKKEREN